MTRIDVVVSDMAGTTVVDDGLVLEAFERAWDGLGYADGAERGAAVEHVIATMGQSKIAVFRALVPEEQAQALNRAFEAALDDLVAAGRVTAMPGAEEALRALIADGRTVILTTGFARPTADAIIGSLGWQTLAPAVLTPADAGRGRPAPDLNLLAAMRAEATSMASLAVVGDTESDARSGVNAGAGLVIAVRTGGVPDDRLRAAGAHAVIDSIAALPALLAAIGR